MNRLRKWLMGEEEQQAPVTKRPPVPCFVWGPPGCGKTRDADRLRQAFGCTSVVDGWSPGQPCVPGALHLSNAQPRPHEVPNPAFVFTYYQAIYYAEKRGL